MDWQSIPFKLFGDRWSGQSYSSIDVMFLPCATRLEAFDGSTLGGGDDCVWDKNEVVEYLGEQLSIVTVYNQNVFD